MNQCIVCVYFKRDNANIDRTHGGLCLCKYIVKYTCIRIHEVALFKSHLDYFVTNMFMLNIRYSTGIIRNDLTLSAT